MTLLVLSRLIFLLCLVQDGATHGMQSLYRGTFPSLFSQAVLLKRGGISDKPLENHLIRISLGPLRQLPALKNKQTIQLKCMGPIEWTGMWSINFSIISHQVKGKEGNKLYA